MTDCTVATMGRAGVELAILDGMQAAEKARENEQQREVIDGLHDQIDALNGQIEALKKRLAAKDRVILSKDNELESLRRKCRDYRQILGTGYAKAIRAAKDDVKYRPLAIRNGILWMAGGMSIMVVVFVLILSMVA